MLSSCATPLCEAYDLAMLDLDGVVYIGAEAVPGAAEHLQRARDAGMRCAFVTNNASRPPEAVADHLGSLGVHARPDDVVTSAQAAARLLADGLSPQAHVVVLGASGLEDAVRETGLCPVRVEDRDATHADAIVTGFGPDVTWGEIMRAAVRIRDGLWWVASNTDQTFPSRFGVAPGHGVLVDTLRRFSGVDPVVAGKPAVPLLEETMRRGDGERPLLVGDRLDTDIEGSRQVGVDSLLVLTGVTGLPELAAASPTQRPTYVGTDLGSLLRPQPAPEPDGPGWALGGWTARVEPDAATGRLLVRGAGTVEDWWRVVAVACWRVHDEQGAPPDTTAVAPPTDQ